MPRPRGRPRFYDDPIEFEAKVEDYFAECLGTGKVPTLTGISYHLGFCDLESFTTYGTYDGFSRTVKRARLRCQEALEQNMLQRSSGQAGPIFLLKANYGLSDQPKQDGMSLSDFGRAVVEALRSADKMTTEPAQDGDDDAEMV